MVRDQRIDRAIQQPLAQRVAVALLPQRRVQAHATVEVANVGINQVQAVDADIRRDRQAFRLGTRQQRHTGGAADAADMHARPGHPDQLENCVQRNRFCHHRYTAQAQPGRQCAAGSHTTAQPAVLRAQPDGVAKTGCILQRAQQHLGIGQWHLGLAEAHTAGLCQLHHLGQRFALQGACQSTQRKDPRLVLLFGAKLEHFNQTWLVEHGVGVGRTDHAGDTPCDGRCQLAFQHTFVFVARFAQPDRQIDQPGCHHAACGIDDFVG